MTQPKRTLLVPCLLLSIFCPILIFSQPNFTANDQIPTYNGSVRAGVNFDIYRGFADEDLARLAAGDPKKGVAGLGIKAVRPGFFEDFAELFGYESRLDAFKLYDSLGLHDNTLIVGFPSDAHRDTTFYCPGVRSTVFKNMYAPIWDGGANGTPVNDTNYYALYIWKVANLYKKHVKFYEVWNEPGFDFTGSKGWLPKGAPGNWWDNNPEPCDYKLRAPVFNYVRLLRITYEVVKSIDPSAYVVTSGLGYPSFLDAILRNTDNPDGGKLTPQYPRGGGAYFDGIGYHAYPHFDDALRAWNPNLNRWDYYRHSDAAAIDPERLKNQFESVLQSYGYHGGRFPKKMYLITETNLPRKEFGEYIGSAEAQKNWIIKAYVNCAQNDIWQMHIFKIAEETEDTKATYEFDVMGLLKKIHYSNKTRPDVNDEGVAFKTTSQILFGLKYDSVRTKALNLAQNIGGGAFRDSNGVFTYVLWAKTTTDKSELANATYAFPAGLGLDFLVKREWNFAQNQNQTAVSAQNIALTATPIFLTERKIRVSQQFICEGNSVMFDDMTPSVSRVWTIQIAPNQTVTDAAKSVTRTFTKEGQYTVAFEGKDANGNVIARQSLVITVEKTPTASIEATVQNPFVLLKSRVQPSVVDEIKWSFSDGTSSALPNLNKIFASSGRQTITFTAKNRCGTATATQTVQISAPEPPRLTKTANDTTPQYDGVFRAGVNMRYTEGWTDEQIADIAAGNLEMNIDGVGAKSLRTSLPAYFTNFWGTDIRKKTFNHYENLDLKNIVLTIGYPDSSQRDPNFYCFREQSYLFKNLYTNIWDNGTNGTIVNDSNYFAKYVYEMVKMYKDEVKYWEIWDTPGWDIEGKNGWKPRGWQHNWWENNPDPCELGTAAPVQHLIRMLRIAYEIIKKEDPSAYVVFSGAGFASYLDAICRNTDNPEDGAVTPQYPYTGGAYFDAVLYNVFPHFDGSLAGYDVAAGQFVYRRNSDAAAQSILKQKNDLETVLNTYGYDGRRFPKKQFVIGSINIPRKPLGALGFGNDEVQRNFILKSYVTAMLCNVSQMNVRNISEDADFDAALDASEVMGLYQKLGSTPYSGKKNVQATAFKTASDILYGTRYDSVRTRALNLPNSVRGGAFRHANGKYTYCLWAVVTGDMQEWAKVNYAFPSNVNGTLFKREWTFSKDKKSERVNGQNLELTAVPIFLSEDSTTQKPPVAAFTSDAVKACPTLTVNFSNKSTDGEQFTWYLDGGTPAVSTERNPSVKYSRSGVYDVVLEVKNASGTHRNRKLAHVEVESLPKANFAWTTDSGGLVVRFRNLTTNSFSMIWDFGDSSITNNSLNPVHRFKERKVYTVRLIAFNDCGRDTIFKQIDLRPTSTNEPLETSNVYHCFPNPTSDLLKINVDMQRSARLTINMLDVQGRVLSCPMNDVLLSDGSHQFSFDVSNLPKGVFLVQFIDAEKRTTFKRIVKL